MRKVYKKPSIYIESFELDTAVCSCGAGANSGDWYGKPNHGGPDVCYYGFEGVGNFSDMPTSPCAIDKTDGIEEIPADADGDWYCYHNPTDDIGKVIFAS